MPNIQIDTSQLAFPFFTIPESGTGLLDGSTSPPTTVSLPVAGQYHLQQGTKPIPDFAFDLKADGTVDFDAAFDGFVSGRGEPRLTVHGLPVTLDATTLDHGLRLQINGAYLPADRSHDLFLLPSSHYRLDADMADGYLEFGLGLDGTVQLDPRFTGFATASGSRLTILGHTITIDGRNLSHDLFARPPDIQLSRNQDHQLTLMPGTTYQFQAGGIVADMQYDLKIDGSVDFPESCDDFLTGKGTSTLILLGYPIVIDATNADSDLVDIANLGLSTQRPRELFAVLLPAKGYAPQTVNGVFSTAFNIDRDGRINPGPGAAGRYVVTTAAAPDPSAVAEDVTLNVYVRPVEPTQNIPQGIVTFMVGANIVGDATLKTDGTARLRTSLLPQGEYDIVITYTGPLTLSQARLRCATVSSSSARARASSTDHFHWTEPAEAAHGLCNRDTGSVAAVTPPLPTACQRPG